MSVSPDLVFTYNYNDLCVFAVTTPGCGDKSSASTIYGPCKWQGVYGCLSTELSGQLVDIPDKNDTSGTKYSQLRIITITATDETDSQNPNTLGVLQYAYQFSGNQTFYKDAPVPVITSNISIASGIFESFMNNTVNTVFDNTTLDRVITIKGN